jgi:hypothetical protein
MLNTNNRIILTDRLCQTYAHGDPTPTQEDLSKYRAYLANLADWQISGLYDTWLKEELKHRATVRNPKPQQKQPTLL